MDLYGENRTMVHMDTVARKDKNEGGYHGWGDYTAVLLDHYCRNLEFKPRSGNTDRMLPSHSNQGGKARGGD